MTPPKILIVDDDEVIRNLLLDTLSPDGYSVESASNAEEALEKIKKEMFTLIITDLRMPGGLEGLELLKTIRSMNIDSEVIIITGYGTPDSVVKAMKSGAIDYIEKPFGIPEFKNLVAQVLDQRKFRNAAEKDTLLNYVLTTAQFSDE